MTRTRKLLGAVLLSAVVAANVVTTAFAADATETYAYLPDRSVYFYDVTENHGWAAQKIDSLAAAEVILGSGDYLFYPTNPITRADFIVMLDRAYGMSEALESGVVTAQGAFSDVPDNTYYTESIAAARAFGIAEGSWAHLAWQVSGYLLGAAPPVLWLLLRTPELRRAQPK